MTHIMSHFAQTCQGGILLFAQKLALSRQNAHIAYLTRRDYTPDTLGRACLNAHEQARTIISSHI